MALTAEQATAPSSDGPTLSRQKDPQYITGRRAFFKYRELGLSAATDGKVHAQITTATQPMSEPTTRHYHICEGQFVIMLNGWVDLVFENGDEVRIGEGDSLYIPGGLRHNETATSDTFELLEVTLPANMGREACDPPEGMAS